MNRRTGVLLTLMVAALIPGEAGAAGVELISRVPLRLAPDTTGWTVSRPALSADGRYTAYLSFAANLAPGQNDANLASDVFLHDRVTGTTTLVSHAAGAPARAAERGSNEPLLSADGRFVVYFSTARDIVAGVGEVRPEQSEGHVYLWDRETGQNTLVSRRAGGAEGGDGGSFPAAISADGGVVVFTSRATDLIPGLILTGLGEHIYAYERATGTITLVDRSPASPTRSGDSASFGPTVSADGRFVAYLSSAGDLVAGQNDTNGPDPDLFLFDRLTGATLLVSHAAGSALTTPNGGSYSATLSADGRYVLFGSAATDLVPGVSDTNGVGDVFLYDRLAGTLTLVSLAGPGVAGGGFAPEISLDGSTAAYFLSDPNPPAGGQIVAYDVASGSRSLVTRGLESPSTFADRGANSLSLSADGRIVAFTSAATNLVASLEDASGGKPDLFVHDRATGVTVLASHAAGSRARTGDDESFRAALSADGGWAGYSSAASDLAAGVRDSAGTADLFLYERATGENRAVTRHPPGMATRTARGFSVAPSLSADGRYVAFASSAALVPGLVVPEGRSNIYLHDRVTRRTVLVSRSARPGLAGGDGLSVSPRISRDGSAVLFLSEAGDLVPGQEDRAGTYDVFLWDRRTGRTTLVSHAHGFPTRAGAGLSLLGDLSADGNVVVFESLAGDLVPRLRDGNEGADVFVWDRRTGATSLVSHHGREPSRTGNAFSLFSAMSPDGAFIAFDSQASDLLLPVRDNDEQTDAFLYERRTGRVSLLSQAAAGFIFGNHPLISADGRWAAFFGTRGGGDRFRSSVAVLNRATGQTVEVDLAGDPDGFAFPTALSDNGRWLLFSSEATGLVPGQDDTPGTTDLFLFDRVSRQVRLVSHVIGEPLRAGGISPGRASLSPNGRWVTFQSDTLRPGEIRAITQVYLYDRTTGEVVLASRSHFDPSQPGGASSYEQVVAGNGIVAFSSAASDLVQGDFNFTDVDVFVFAPEGGL